MREFDDRAICTIDRRRCPDRRTLNVRTFIYSIFKGRRHGPQRIEEQDRFYYKDVYDAKLLLIVLLILTFSATDAGLTLLILEKGGVELNPVMVWALESSNHTFFTIKYLLTAFGLMTLVVHINFRVCRWITMHNVLLALLSFYLLLIGYEFSILAA